MRAVIFTGSGSVTVGQIETPKLQERGDALVRVTLSAICGSDALAYRGDREREAGPIGHEFTGVVEAAGEDVTRLRPGQRVVSPFSVHCGGCFYCKQGELTACERLQLFGRDLGGAQAEYVRVPNADAVLEPIADAVTDERAIFAADVLSGAFAGLQSAGLRAGQSVAVVGCGPTGLCAQLLVRTMGAAQVFGIDHHEYRLATASETGAVAINARQENAGERIRALTGGRGADIAVEAVGTAEALADAAKLVRPRGTLLSLGTSGESEFSLPIGQLTARQIRLVPAGMPSVKNVMATLLRMLERGVLDPMPIASHTLPLAEASLGYELMATRSGGALKVLLRP